VFSAQVLIYAFVGQVYPAPRRATGLGWTAGGGATDDRRHRS
jgi:MFS transporter, AAHS family, benzoate transport protein